MGWQSYKARAAKKKTRTRGKKTADARGGKGGEAESVRDPRIARARKVAAVWGCPLGSRPPAACDRSTRPLPPTRVRPGSAAGDVPSRAVAGGERTQAGRARRTRCAVRQVGSRRKGGDGIDQRARARAVAARDGQRARALASQRSAASTPTGKLEQTVPASSLTRRAAPEAQAPRSKAQRWGVGGCRAGSKGLKLGRVVWCGKGSDGTDAF